MSLAQEAKRDEIIKSCQAKYPDYGGEELYTQTQVRAAMEEYAKLAGGEYVKEQLGKEVERLKGIINAASHKIYLYDWEKDDPGDLIMRVESILNNENETLTP